MESKKRKLTNKSRNRPRNTEDKLVIVRGKKDRGMGKVDEEKWGVLASSYEMDQSGG